MGIVISSKEIKVNGIPLSTLDNIGFEYKYVYYEPEVPNYFKIVNGPDNAEYRVELTDEEKVTCESFLASWVAPEPEQTEISVQAEDPIIYFVTTEGVLGGCKPKSQLQEGEVKIPQESIKSVEYASVNHIDFTWDAEKAGFVGLGYKNQRLKRYYDEVRINEQLDAIWDFIELSGLPLSTKTQAVFDKIKLIKQQIPKQ
jgi:hypothetical protein